MAYITQYHWFSCNLFGSADIQPQSCTKMLIFYKKNIFSRLAQQFLKIVGTKIRKLVPHDMKPVLATNWPTFYDLVDFWSPIVNRGIYIISLVRSFVRPSIHPSQLISKTALTIFLKFGMKLGIHKGSTVTEPGFLKRSRLGENGVNLLKNSFFFTFRKNCSKDFFFHCL